MFPFQRKDTMKKFTRYSILVVILLALLLSYSLPGTSAREPRASKAAVERTREQVKMLDDVYKVAVVLITQHYVKTEDDLPAGTAAKALFAAIKEKGWHEVSLLDATGEPYNDENTPTDSFDKEAVKSLKGGKSFVDSVITRDGKKYLRAATPIPVVMEKCTMCHENYKSAKEGEPIGILSYTVPIK